jgi:streptogramin lyase
MRGWRSHAIVALVVASIAAGVGLAGAAPLGEIRELPQGPGISPDSITTGPDGNLWYTRDGFDGLVRITVDGVTTEFPGLSDNPSGITLGPDGNLWFTMFDAVGRMTAPGVYEEFASAGTAGMSGRGITTGPDGLLWFAQFNQGQIGTIDPLAADPAATINELNVGINPYAITVGSDGNLWFTLLFGGGGLGRMTPEGIYTEFPLPIADREPLGIASGSDGLIYFTERDVGIVGTVDPNAVDPISTYAEIQVSSGGLQEATLGPDGAVWVSVVEPPAFARITTDGVVTLYPLSAAEQDPRGITAGPDCNVWQVSGFEEAEAFVNSIGTGLEPPDCTPPAGPEPIVLEPTFTG